MASSRKKSGVRSGDVYVAVHGYTERVDTLSPHPSTSCISSKNRYSLSLAPAALSLISSWSARAVCRCSYLISSKLMEMNRDGSIPDSSSSCFIRSSMTDLPHRLIPVMTFIRISFDKRPDTFHVYFSFYHMDHHPPFRIIEYRISHL